MKKPRGKPFEKGRKPHSHKKGCGCFRCTHVSCHKGKPMIHSGSFKKGHVTNLGRKMSETTKRKIGDSNRGKVAGEKHYCWKGGTSKEPYGFEFNDALKQQIKERDNFTCQECGYVENDLDCPLVIHHIDYDKKNNDPENLISLCNSCHSQTNFKRQDWVTYFQKANGRICACGSCA